MAGVTDPLELTISFVICLIIFKQLPQYSVSHFVQWSIGQQFLIFIALQESQVSGRQSEREYNDCPLCIGTVDNFESRLDAFCNMQEKISTGYITLFAPQILNSILYPILNQGSCFLRRLNSLEVVLPRIRQRIPAVSRRIAANSFSILGGHQQTGIKETDSKRQNGRWIGSLFLGSAVQVQQQKEQ